ncbi:Beta-1,4-glucuronyltransferase 1 [Desmophyllum pertusum]|uniref:Beta-1,4-glucuronyltransferase 1 n=1 Tax=Desmophyllum pertusum TaxID=174260 RepID=A0A9W9YU66_9CNID|nr:Beta-1,4-glucuronyltransferase 1 [Desmophyllum pertusum]
MRLNKITVILFLGFLVVTLVSVNVFLLSKLQYKEPFSDKETLVRFQDLLEKKLDFKQLPTDSSGQYKIEVNFLPSRFQPVKGQHDVTLVTHCTSNHLHYLLDLTKHWKGPISLAVFVPGYDVVTTYTSLIGLHQCDHTFRDRVTVHLVYPMSHPPPENELGTHLKQALNHQGNCDEFLARLNNNDVAGEHNWNYANVKV